MQRFKPKFLAKVTGILLLSCCNVYALNNDVVNTSYVANIQTLAQHAYQQVNSPIIQIQLKQINGLSSATVNTPKNPEAATPSDVLIFVSFSMPDNSLRQWLMQAQRIQAPLIIQGLIHNSFSETQAKIAKLMSDNQGGIVLDPRLFSDYQITQVPGVVVRNVGVACLPTQNCLHVYPFAVVMGDVGLEAALSTIANQEDGAAKDIAQAALQTERTSP